jgi:hypothetical protein
MRRVNISRLLERAEGQFSMGDYGGALVTYGVLLTEFPENREAKIGVFLSDIGLESPQEAQALFDYYQIIKNDKDDAIDIMLNLISSLDSAKENISQIVNNMEDRVDYQDGIGYKDFLNFVESRGDFNRAFEDVMFSTKVILKGKDEYIDFISRLIDKGEDKLAEQFLDSMSSSFEKSQDVYELYNRLKLNSKKR